MDSTADAALPAQQAIAGRLFLLTGDLFDPRESTPYTSLARVDAPAAAGGYVSVDAIDGQYALQGVEVASAVWTGVVPLDDGDALTTLQPLDTRRAGGDAGSLSVDLLLIRRSALELILSILTAPAEVLPGRGHVVLRFVHPETLQPEAFVQVTTPPGGTRAYDAQQSWSSDTLGTGPRGLAVLANLTALPYPGTQHMLTLTGASSSNVVVQVAADAVTLVTVAVAR